MEFPTALALAARPPSAAVWEAILEDAAYLDAEGLAALDAALAGWPDAMRVARTADIATAGEALRVVRRLELEKGVIDRARLEDLLGSGLIGRVTSLALFSLETTLDAIEVVASTPLLPELAELQLATADLDGASAILANSTLPLRVLTFEGGSASDDGLVSLSAGHGLARLEHLQYHDAAVDDPGLAALAGAARWAPLRHLRISYAAVGSEGATALAASPHLRRLETLDLRLTHVGATGAGALATSDVCRTLTELYLDEAELGARGVTALARRWTGGALRVLGLAHNRTNSLRSPDWQVGPAGARALAQAPWTRQLERLDLAGNALGDDGARAIATSSGFPALRELDLSMNDITDAGVEALLAHGLLARLARLKLAHTEMSSQALDALCEACDRQGVLLVQ